MFKFASALLIAGAAAQFRGRGMRISRRRLAGNEGRTKTADINFTRAQYR